MIRLHHLLPALITTITHAGELTLEMKPFFVSHTFAASVLPEAAVPLRLEPETWTSFTITSIANHGSGVKKDQPLIVFDAREIDESLADTRHAIAAGGLELAQAEHELKALEESVPLTLTRLKRAAESAADEFRYFTDIRKKATAEATASVMKQNELILDAHMSELQQLHHLRKSTGTGGAAGEKGEATLGQQERIEAAVFALRMENHNHNRTLTVTIPREELELIEKRDDTAALLAKAENELPRAVDLRKLAVEKLATTLLRNKESLSALEQDRRLFDFRAPSDGLFFHGTIKGGKWSSGDITETLGSHGSPPVGKDLATFIPQGTRLIVQADLDQATALALPAQVRGVANLPGREDVNIPLTLESVSNSLNSGEGYPARFAAEWPAGLEVLPTQSLRVRVVSHAVDNAITIPSSALAFGPQGWSVEVKLADGDSEHRPVTRGRSSDTDTEILEGLEVGQVIIVP